MLVKVPSVPSDYFRWFPLPSELPRDPAARAAAEQQAFEAFATEALLTVDEHDKDNPRKPLPLFTQFAYLRVLFWGYFTRRKVYCCKGRKLAVTVGLTILCTWEAHYRPNRLMGWVTQDRTDGQMLIERYINNGYIESFAPWLKSRYEYDQSKGNLVIARRKGFQRAGERFQEQAWGTSLLAYPSGADQLRQLPHSLVVVDEGHTIREMRKLLQGTAPGLNAADGVEGGKMVVVFVARRGSHVETMIGPRGRQAIALARERLTPAA